ncbi:glycine/betaine ABC transporter substrate-binding protein [Actinophytocola xinjiangensis]|uniref:Glycine/betaine ABC transporter substrate-binding protein n=1 Tax=Actinophytocola xinjiangensis TaxID=485602 RepID=A0A7Z1AVK2_9PSEU|nr:ABC transporter substrate-binding protein [Actinophytocola xinjiangensis]OLF06528.1 glycine/betaine ABC transporter substrate-binding protein [Actinophytocola xinjiangensis]
MKRVLAGLATAATALVLAACGSSDPLAEDSGDSGDSGSKETISIGSADFPESQLLAEIYAQALEGKGVTVERQFNLGSREKYFDGLKDGSIDLIPEYTGVLLQFVNKDAKEVESEEVYAALQTALPENLIVLEKATAEDKDAVVVTRETADKWSLKSIDDLVPHCGEVVFGGPTEIQQRPDGIPGIQSTYGCTFKSFKALQPGAITTKALVDGTVQAADIFTTDSAIEANDLVVLEDPKNNFAAQNVVPLVNKDKASAVVTDTLNALSAKLDTETLLDLNARLNAEDKPDYSDVAEEWLAEIGV